MKITVASGKGGTGKTTVAVNLALSIDNSIMIDCDVEGPNSHLFFNGPTEFVKNVSIPAPEIDLAKCSKCGKCAEFCQYNAISMVNDSVLFFKELCHGCGGCKIICPDDAITEIEHQIGIIEKGGNNDHPLLYGLLNISEPFGVPIIRELKDLADDSRTVIFDSPPGTACPAVEAMRDVDFCILVTEPTPFGLHDLTLTVDVIREIGTPFGVIINRDGIGDDRIDRYCVRENIPILSKIGNDMRIAELYSRGIPMVVGIPEFKQVFTNIYEKIREMI